MSNRRTKYHCGTLKCMQVINVSEVMFQVMNDEGGIVFTCNSCSRKQGIRLSNPQESFHNLGGVRPLAYWMDYEEAAVLAEHGLTEADLIKTPGYRYQPPKTEPLPWPGTDRPLYEHLGTNFEAASYAALESLAVEVNEHYKRYLNGWYLKRHPCDRTFVVLEAGVDEQPQRLIFSKNVDTERDLHSKNLLLVDHNGCNLAERVDGIYTKSECLDFLKKLFLRWKQLTDGVLIVVPFVGYTFTGSDLKNLELWKFLNSHTDAAKTQLLTRSATFSLFKKATDRLDVPFATLQEWDFLTDMTKSMSSADNKFLERSHAKFYTGIFSDRVEMLSGSFNINAGGPSLENVSFKVYDKAHFRLRYLDKVRPGFVYPPTESLNAHYMVFRHGKFVTENVTSLEDFKNKYLGY
ncbi:MAG: hypothetical protein JWP45_455 [Mucilaginibacter sp.]|nr:hypothetical protein [Mucilaginibacter sp.]